MQSESSTLKKVIDKVLPAKVDQPLARQAAHVDFPSLQPIGGLIDIETGAVEASLEALTVASAMAKKIPFISPVASLLLQALNMRAAVKQNKEEWDLVMVKLEQIAGLVDNIGTLCGKYNLEEKDLPPGLREIFQSLKMELCGINTVLKQSKEIGSIKQMLLHKDLLRKVRQYDSTLSSVIQMFQVTLALDTRFAQLANQKKNKGTRGISDTVKSAFGRRANKPNTAIQSVRTTPAVTLSMSSIHIELTQH